MFQNLQGTAIHTYANKILVHTVTIPSPLVVALPIQSPMLMPVTYERCSYVLSFGGRCPYLNLNSFASSIQEMFLCSVLSLVHQPVFFGLTAGADCIYYLLRAFALCFMPRIVMTLRSKFSAIHTANIYWQSAGKVLPIGSTVSLNYWFEQYLSSTQSKLQNMGIKRQQ